VLAEDLLHAANGVAVAIKQEADAAQEGHVLGPVIAPASAALHGLELRELALPEAQDVLRDRKLFGNLADGAKRLRRLIHPVLLSGTPNAGTPTPPPFSATAHR
jgi:hypothetical protein